MIHTAELPFGKELFSAWDDIDKRGASLEGARVLAKHDRFYLLVKVLNRTDMLHPWLYARCREVEQSPDGHLDLWAREHYKSTIITFAGTIQEVLRDPEITVGIFSHTRTISRTFMSQIEREFSQNETLRRLFPDILWDNPERQAPSWSLENGLVVRRVSNPKESTIEAWGLVDSQPIGKHFRLMVFDDVVTPLSVNTPEQIAKTTEAWEIADNLGVVGGRKWHIGTRYSYADTYEEMLKRGAVKPRIYPATDNGAIDGNPVFFNREEWDRRVRDQGEATIACQMLQNPLAGQQKMFSIDDLQTYEVRPETLNVYVMCDPARSKKKDSAKTAVAVIGIDAAMNKYLLDGANHKMDLGERWQCLRDIVVKWRREPGVQSIHVGYEAYGALADIDYFHEKMRESRNSFEIEELKWPREGPGSKEDRVQRLGPDFRGHRFFIPAKHDPKRLTKNQSYMASIGSEHRIAKNIRKRDENGVIYDLTEAFKVQVHYFPFGGSKDLIDAVSRIYDMEPSSPYIIPTESLEPEYT